VLVRKNTKHDLLRAVPLFSRCTRREIAELAGECDELSVPEGTQLTREGARGREFMVIVDGEARVTKNGRSVNRLGPGDFLGEIALLADVPRTATVTTEEPTLLLVLTDRGFDRVAKRMPTVRTRLLTVLAERLAATGM
jgi:CRP/FNR family transcriptional regulator, cyclic AMP receptor protein